MYPPCSFSSLVEKHLGDFMHPYKPIHTCIAHINRALPQPHGVFIWDFRKAIVQALIAVIDCDPVISDVMAFGVLRRSCRVKRGRGDSLLPEA